MRGQRETAVFRRKWLVDDDGHTAEEHSRSKLAELHETASKHDALIMGEKRPVWKLIGSNSPGMKTLTVEVWVWRLTSADRPTLAESLAGAV